MSFTLSHTPPPPAIIFLQTVRQPQVPDLNPRGRLAGNKSRLPRLFLSLADKPHRNNIFYSSHLPLFCSSWLVHFLFSICPTFFRLSSSFASCLSSPFTHISTLSYHPPTHLPRTGTDPTSQLCYHQLFYGWRDAIMHCER